MPDETIIDYRHPATTADQSESRNQSGGVLTIFSIAAGACSCAGAFFAVAHLNDFGRLLAFPAAVGSIIGIALGLGAWFIRRGHRGGVGEFKQYPLRDQFVLLAMVLSMVALGCTMFVFFGPAPHTDF